MQISDVYFPWDTFARSGKLGSPRVFIAPQRYVQGRNVLPEIGRYMALVGAQRVAVLASGRGIKQDGARLLNGLRAAGIEATVGTFRGECSRDEIDQQVSRLRNDDVQCLIAVGGGKCVDTGKAVAFRLDVPVVVVPTLASNDAPCSALSVLYTPEGVTSGVEFYPTSPALVVVDTDIVAAAPPRYLVAGIGDAMSTWYEALTCQQNPTAVTAVGARPTLAAGAIGEACARTLFEHAVAAADAVARSIVDDALEHVVEANTLLSGLGFESGGVAAAHGFAQSATALPGVHAGYLHGEMVALGTLVHLMLEARPDEAERVAALFARVGLPVHLGQLSLDGDDIGALTTIVDGMLAFPFIGNMPREVTATAAKAAILDADALGRAVSARDGDAPYRTLHAA
jgi:glycerol dehydrogenase